jgi:hypothetical protein
LAIISKTSRSRRVNAVSPPVSGFSDGLACSLLRSLRAIIGESGEPPTCSE